MTALRKWGVGLALAVALSSASAEAAAPHERTNISARQLAQPYLTTSSLQFSVDKNSTITREVITTDGESYLNSILPKLPEPNRSIVILLLQYPASGQHTYWWPRKGEESYDGSTTDVILNGRIVMRGEQKTRTFCCGLTLEVFYKYLHSQAALTEQIAQENFDEFKRYWFCREIFSPGPLDAMTTYSVGIAVENPEDALPGDFIQIWRQNKSGHSVIFVNWLRDTQGNRVGLQYWSTQPATNGIGFHSELFGTLPKQIIESHVSVARPLHRD